MTKVKNRWAYCLVILLSVSAPVHADIGLDVSINVLRFDYEEFDESGDTYNHETGFIPGMSLVLSGSLSSFTHSLEFELYDGQVDYDGQTQSGIPHTTDTNENLKRIAYRLNWSPQKDNDSLYLKIGQQQWERDILPANNVSGLFERYQWRAIEIGLSAALHEDDKNLLALQFGVSRIDNGTIEIDLNAYGYGYPKLNLGDGTGASGAIMFQRRLSEQDKVSLSLEHQRWTFGRSNTATLSRGFQTIEISEPRSITNHSIISFQYGHYF